MISRHFRRKSCLLFCVLLVSLTQLHGLESWGQDTAEAATTSPSTEGNEVATEAKSTIDVDSGLLSAFKLRSIGPAVMSGRISDIAVNPVQPNTWYVAAGSGNLWKTTNAGTTWTAIFDNYPS